MATATATAIMTSTDEQIQRDVLAELKWDARVQPNEIGVAVKDGVVTLTGWVDSYTKKWAAEEAAHRVRGVRAVANDIEVRLPASQCGTRCPALPGGGRRKPRDPQGHGAFVGRARRGRAGGLGGARRHRGGRPYHDLPVRRPDTGPNRYFAFERA